MSDERKDGGAAFPHTWKYGNANTPGGETTEMAEGMSIRDYFAAKALQGVLGNQERMKMLIEKDGLPADGVEASERLALRCYQMSDAMLKARNS